MPPPPPAQPAASVPALPEALASIPDDQKALIIRVLSMTPDQINQLPPAERSNIIQLVRYTTTFTAFPHSWL
jgi:cleavage stimulation factor subunit 2